MKICLTYQSEKTHQSSLIITAFDIWSGDHVVFHYYSTTNEITPHNECFLDVDTSNYGERNGSYCRGRRK